MTFITVKDGDRDRLPEPHNLLISNIYHEAIFKMMLNSNLQLRKYVICLL